MKLEYLPIALKRVFKNKRYLISALLVALIFYSANVIVNNWKALLKFYSTLGFLGTSKFFLTLLLTFGETIKLHSYISLIIISLLFGILFSLLIYKTKKLSVESGKAGFFSTLGIFLGILAPGCAACGIGLLPAIGVSAAFFSFLPFEGLELSILSIIILLFVILKISKSISYGDVCKINIKNERRLKWRTKK